MPTIIKHLGRCDNIKIYPRREKSAGILLSLAEARKLASRIGKARLKPSLRERECREQPIAREQGHGNVPGGTGPLGKSPTPETVQTMDPEKPYHDQKQDHINRTGPPLWNRQMTLVLF